MSRQFKLAFEGGNGWLGGKERAHAKPLNSKRQFITARYVLYNYVLFFDARSQERFAGASYKSRNDFCVPSGVDYGYAEVRS